MSRMLATDLIQNGNTLQMKLKSCLGCSTGCFSEESSDFTLCGLVKFQIRMQINVIKKPTFHRSETYFYGKAIFIKLSKIFQSDNVTYTVELESKGGKRMLFVNGTDDTIWKMFYEQVEEEYQSNNDAVRDFHLKLSLDIASCSFTGFSALYEDTEFSDFELRGVDGSVNVHKAVLVGYSPVMKAMLSGPWKEASTGVLEVSNETTKVTLQQLKDYMYLQKLPGSGLEELSILATYYVMSDLKERCTVKLIMSVTEENASKLLSFAVKHEMERLKLAILVLVQCGLIKVANMIKSGESC